MFKFFKNHFATVLIALLVLTGIAYGAAIPGARQIWRAKVIGWAADVDSIITARTDTGASATVTTGIIGMARHQRISATTGGTAADIRAEQVVVTGTDPNGTTITETLPIFTVNTATTVTGTKIFATITSVLFPAMDGTGATISIGNVGAPTAADVDSIHTARTDTGASATVTTGTSINFPDVPRNVTATSGGTAGDIRAESVVITGKDVEGATVTETLPAFTVNSAGTVTGSKIFAEITSILFPAMDGTGATISIGHGEVLGLDVRLKRNTVRNAYLANTKEGTPPTVTTDTAEIESNGVDLDSSLNSTQAIIEYMETPE